MGDTWREPLEAAVTERTAAVYRNTPNNPPGRALTEAYARGPAEAILGNRPSR